MGQLLKGLLINLLFIIMFPMILTLYLILLILTGFRLTFKEFLQSD